MSENLDLIEPKTAEELALSFEVFFVPMAEVMADNIEREVLEHYEFFVGSEVGDCAKS